MIQEKLNHLYVNKPNLIYNNFYQAVTLNPELQRAQIGAEEIELQQQIGSGSFGEVYVGTWRGTKVAIKRMLQVNEISYVMQDFLSEASMMRLVIYHCIREANPF